MEEIKETLQTITRAIRERLFNPIYSAFIVSWIFVNYRVILVLVGDAQWREKIRYIDLTLFPTIRDVFLYGFLQPIAASITYVLVSPYIYRHAMIYIRNCEKKTVEQLLRIAEETPLSQSEKRRLFESMRGERLKFKQDLEGLQTENQNLREQVTQLSIELISARNQNGREEADPGSTKTELDDIAAMKKWPKFPKQFEFNFTDFVGISGDDINELLQRGITRGEYALLKKIKNLPAVTLSEFTEIGGFSSEDAHTYLQIFQGLGLLDRENIRREDSVQLAFKLSPLGRQALKVIADKYDLPA